MAYTSILFENPTTGSTKSAPVGFSWTTLFFGFFPALLRGDMKWGIIQLILAIFTAGLSGLIFMFIYNKLYIKGLIDKGFKARSIARGDLDFSAGKMGIVIPRLSETSTETSL